MNRDDVRVLEVASFVAEIRRQQRLPERNPQELQAAGEGGRAAAVHPEDHEGDGARGTQPRDWARKRPWKYTISNRVRGVT